MGIPTASPDCWKDASELIAYKDPTQNRLNKYKIQFRRILTSQIWDESVNSQRQSWDPSLYFLNNSFPLKILHPLLEERKKAECGNIYCNKYSKMLTAFTSPTLKCLCLLSFNARTLPSTINITYGHRTQDLSSLGNSDFGQHSVTLVNIFKVLGL